MCVCACMQVTVGTGIITRKKENCCKIAKVCVFFFFVFLFFVVENGISSGVTREAKWLLVCHQSSSKLHTISFGEHLSVVQRERVAFFCILFRDGDATTPLPPLPVLLIILYKRQVCMHNFSHARRARGGMDHLLLWLCYDHEEDDAHEFTCFFFKVVVLVPLFTTHILPQTKPLVVRHPKKSYDMICCRVELFLA